MTDLRTIEIPVEPFTAAAFAPFGALVAQPGACGGLRRQSQPQLGSAVRGRGRDPAHVLALLIISR